MKIPGFKRKVFIIGTIYVCKRGAAIINPHVPVSFWTYFDVVAYLAVWAGATLGAMA